MDHISSSMYNPQSTSMGKGGSMAKSGASFGGQVSNMSTPSGGITFQRPENTDPATELEVLKCILLREGYLKRLREMGASAGSSGLRSEVVDLLDLLRIATVETVEMIEDWRKGQAKSFPFVWNGINYLLKMPSDLDFLDEVMPLTSWLGFTLLRNPFVMPNPLDHAMQGGGGMSSLNTLMDTDTIDRSIHPALQPPSIKGPGGVPVSSVNPSIHAGTAHDPTISAIDNDYVRIGGHPVIIPKNPNASKVREQKDLTNAIYNAPVLNDSDMTPHDNKQKRKRHGGAGGQSLPPPMPSQIGDLDVTKIRKCEYMILREEDVYGKYMRDRAGRIMPESQARKANFAATISQYTDNTNPPGISGTVSTEDDSRGDANAVMGGPSGRQRAQKKGGHLQPLTKTGPHVGRKQAPKQLGRGARLENDVSRARKENERLGEELTMLQEQLKEAMETLMDFQMAGPDDDVTPYQVAEQERLVATLKSQVGEMESMLAKREAEASRKEDARDHIKKSQQQHVARKRQAALERKRKQLDEGEVYEEDEGEAISLEEYSATEIQRLARGVHAREYVKQRRARYNYAATMIQACARGYFDRNFVRRKKLERTASIKIQRLARGVAGRAIANRRRHLRLSNYASTEIQKQWRAMKGRMRMEAKRILMSYSALANEVALTVFPSQILELAEACTPSNRRQPPPATVLALVQAGMLFTARRGEKYTKIIPSLGWEEVSKFLRRCKKLARRIRSVAAACSQKLIRVPKAGINLVRAYAHEPMWSPEEMEKIGLGGVACKKLFEWILACLKVVSVQDQFLESELDWPEGEEFWEPESEVEQEADRAEDKMCQAQEVELQRQYVPPDLLLAFRKRPRPVLIVLARDMPSYSKRRFVARLMSDMPSTFVRINLPTVDVPAIQQVFDLGNSAVVDMDIGLGAAQRRAFLSAMTTTKKALVPTPMLILMQGDEGNRHGSGAEQMLGVSGDDLDMMSDKPIKMLLEEQAEALLPVKDGSLDRDMVQLAQRNDPPSSLVVTMEAVIVLLTPTKRFKGPGFSTRSVAWEAGRRLLGRPRALAERLRRFNRNKVPSENVQALIKYTEHEEWPEAGRLNAKSEDAVIRLLCCIGRWVTAVIRYCEVIMEQGGAPPTIGRRYPAGLFASAIACSDPGRDKFGFQSGESTGWGLAYLRLLAPMLEDVRVFRESRKISGRYLTLNVYRDCNRFYFSAYEAKTSVLRYVVLEQKEVNDLLAPNSMEVKGGQTAEPPRSTLEMYERLVRLCRLEQFTEKGKKRAPQTRLVCRRELVGLMQESRKIQGHLAILTVSERARGELFVSAYIPKFSARLDLPITAQVIRGVLPDTDLEERLLWESEDAAQMLFPAIDRLEVFHPTKSSPTLGMNQRRFKDDRAFGLKMRIRTAGGAGRLVLKKSIRLGHGLTQKKIYLVEMFECGEGGPIRINIYNPKDSANLVVNITSRMRIDLINGALSDYAKWCPKLLKRLQVKANAIHMDKTLHVHSRKIVSEQQLDSKRPDKKRAPKVDFYFTFTALVAGGGGGLRFKVYHYQQSKEWTLELSDDDINDHLRNCAAKPGKENQDVENWMWPTADPLMRKDVIEHIARATRWVAETDMLEMCDPVLATGTRSDKKFLADEAKRQEKESAKNKKSGYNNKRRLERKKLQEAEANKKKEEAELKRRPLALEKREVSEREEEVVNGSFKIHRGRWPNEHIDDPKMRSGEVPITALCQVRVYHDLFKAFHFRFEVYNPSNGYTADTSVEGHLDLREILGHENQHLLEPDKQADLLDWLIHSSVFMTPGKYSEEAKEYDTVTNPDAFTISMERQRLYKGDKITHTHKFGDEDAAHNSTINIDNPEKRGFKLFSHTKRMDGELVTLTCFDEMPHLDTAESTPMLRFQGYDAKNSQKTELHVTGDMLLTVAGVELGDPLLRKDQRKQLARSLVEKLRLRMWPDLPYTLELPWQGDPDGGEWALGQTQDGTMQRHPEERTLRRPGKLFSAVMQLNGTMERGAKAKMEEAEAAEDEGQGESKEEVEVGESKADEDDEKTAAPKAGRQDSVLVNLYEKEEVSGAKGVTITVYDPKSCAAAMHEIPSSEVLMALGTMVDDIPEGRVRDRALRSLCQQVKLNWGFKHSGLVKVGMEIDPSAIGEDSEDIVKQAMEAEEAEPSAGAPTVDADDEMPISEKSAAAKADFDELDPDAVVYRERAQVGTHSALVKVLVGDNYSMIVHAWSNQLEKMFVITVTPEQAKVQVSKTDITPTSQEELAQFIVSQLVLDQEEKVLCFKEVEEAPVVAA
jgi:hypothetical protein